METELNQICGAGEIVGVYTTPNEAADLTTSIAIIPMAVSTAKIYELRIESRCQEKYVTNLTSGATQGPSRVAMLHTDQKFNSG